MLAAIKAVKEHFFQYGDLGQPKTMHYSAGSQFFQYIKLYSKVMICNPLRVKARKYDDWNSHKLCDFSVENGVVLALM